MAISRSKAGFAKGTGAAAGCEQLTDVMFPENVVPPLRENVLPASGGFGKTGVLPVMQKGKLVCDSATVVGSTMLTVVPLGAVHWS